MEPPYPERMPSRGPYAKTAATRAQILDSALTLIAGGGPSHATVQQIADAVGLTKAGVLHHFGSREALLIAVLERRDEVDTGDWPHTDDLLDSFVQVVRHNAAVPGLVALYSAMAGAPLDDELRRAFFARRYTQLVGRFAAALTVEQRAGRMVREPDAGTMARLLIATSDGLQTQWLLDSTVDMAHDLGALLDLLRT